MTFADLLTQNVIATVIGNAIAAVTLYLIAKLISGARAPTKKLIGVVMQSAKKNWAKLLSWAIDMACLFFLFTMLKIAVRKTGPIERIDVVEIAMWTFFLLGYLITIAFNRGLQAQRD